jgi:localization factor PodJL
MPGSMTLVPPPSGNILEPPRPAPAIDAPSDRSATGSVRAPATSGEGTGLSPQPQSRGSAPSGADKLPSGIGSAALRTAAVKGDPTAEFEVAVRFADGRRVSQDLTAAAEWFERAAKQGLVPAQFRLGGLSEKGLGVKKDLDAARRLYSAAAQAGHAKAMHNLAVLHAEGIDGKPDYATAARWFRKAADYGVVDSQYNLGILYARGIGVEPNLAEAFKWFTLAARDGDTESVKKRDDVGARLDQATIASARAAAQAWVPETQPETATQVKTPPGGWDAASAPATTTRRTASENKGPRLPQQQ